MLRCLTGRPVPPILIGEAKIPPGEAPFGSVKKLKEREILKEAQRKKKTMRPKGKRRSEYSSEMRRPEEDYWERNLDDDDNDEEEGEAEYEDETAEERDQDGEDYALDGGLRRGFDNRSWCRTTYVHFNSPSCI